MVRSKIKNRISLDFQDQSLRYVVMKEPDVNAVHAFGELDIPPGVIEKGKIVDPDALQKIVKEAVHLWKIKHREVQFHVPDPFVFIRKVDIPESVTEEEIQGYLYMEVGISIPLPFDEPVFDYVLLPNLEGGKNEILLFVSPKDLVMEYAQILENAKLKPLAADITPLSVYRFLYSTGIADPMEHLMCIQFNNDMINVSLFHEHQPLFTRQLLNETFRLESTQLMEDETGIQMGDTFSEIDRIINFYTYSLHVGDVQISKIVLMGDHPRLTSIEKALASFVNIPVESLHHYEFLSLSGEKIPSRFLLTLGLSLKGVK